MSDLQDFIFAELSKPALKFSDYDITFAGRRGAGKSTLAIQFFSGECCIVDVEKGNKQVKGEYKVEPNTWKELKDLQKKWGKAIKEGHKPPFKVLLFDTQTKLALMCQEHVKKENGWEDFTQGNDGKNRWNVLKNEYDTVMNKFKEQGFQVVYICHGKDKTIKLRGQEEYKQFVPDVGATFDYTVLGAVDFVFYLEKTRVENENGDKEEVRRLVMQNDLDYDVKCRFPELPDEIIYKEAKDGVKAFYKAWDKAINKKVDEEDDEPISENFEFASVTNDEEEINEVVETKVVENEDEELDVVSDELPENFNIEELRTKAIAVRDKLMEKLSTNEVKDILRNELGKLKIANVDDVEALKLFISKHE